MASARTAARHAVDVVVFLALFVAYVAALTVLTCASRAREWVSGRRSPSEPATGRPQTDV